MLDVLMPCFVHEIPYAIMALEALKQDTDVDWRPIVCVDGGTRNDCARIESYLRDHQGARLLRNKGTCYEGHTLGRCFQEIGNNNPSYTPKYVAIMSPTVVVDDKQWFGKMQQPMTKDGLCAMVMHVPSEANPQSPPFPLKMSLQPKDGLIALMSWRHCKGMEFSGSVSEHVLTGRFFGQGSTIWMVPSVRVRMEASSHPECEFDDYNDLEQRWAEKPEVIL